MIDSEERVILKELFSQKNGIELFWFHQYKGLSVAQIYKAVKYLSSLGLVAQDGQKVYIEEAKKITILKRYRDFFCGIEENWKNKIDYYKNITNTLEKELKGFR